MHIHGRGTQLLTVLLAIDRQGRPVGLTDVREIVEKVLYQHAIQGVPPGAGNQVTWMAVSNYCVAVTGQLVELGWLEVWIEERRDRTDRVQLHRLTQEGRLLARMIDTETE